MVEGDYAREGKEVRMKDENEVREEVERFKERREEPKDDDEKTIKGASVSATWFHVSHSRFGEIRLKRREES